MTTQNLTAKNDKKAKRYIIRRPLETAQRKILGKVINISCSFLWTREKNCERWKYFKQVISWLKLGWPRWQGICHSNQMNKPYLVSMVSKKALPCHNGIINHIDRPIRSRARCRTHRRKTRASDGITSFINSKHNLHGDPPHHQHPHLHPPTLFWERKSQFKKKGSRRNFHCHYPITRLK